MENEQKSNKTFGHKNTFWLVALAIIIAVSIGLYSHSTTKTTSAEAEHTANYISAVVSAIASYRQSTQEAGLVTQEYTEKGMNLDSQNIKIAKNLAILMKVSNDFKNGNAYLAQYLDDSNEIISDSAKIINLSAVSILKPNEDMIQAFHDSNVQKQQESLAAVTAAQDDGTNNMNDTMRIIREGLIFELGPNDKLSSASGPIHTPLSVEQRNRLLAQIKNDFPNGVNDYSHDIYSLMMYGIQAALVSNTFEQFHSIANAMTTEGAPALPFAVSGK